VATPGSPFAIPVTTVLRASLLNRAGNAPYLVRAGLTVTADVSGSGGASVLGISDLYTISVTAT